MANTLSNMLPLGTTAPHFELRDTISDTFVTLETITGKKGTVILFICNHCPFVIHVNKEITAIANNYLKKGIGFAAISSNDAIKYPQDAPDNMKLHAEMENYPFPYLYDENQTIAKAYDAACTPDIFVFDTNLKLVYRGQLDDSRPENGLPITGSDLTHALNCLIDCKENKTTQKPSIGCNIKWKVPF